MPSNYEEDPDCPVCEEPRSYCDCGYFETRFYTTTTEFEDDCVKAYKRLIAARALPERLWGKGYHDLNQREQDAIRYMVGADLITLSEEGE